MIGLEKTGIASLCGGLLEKQFLCSSYPDNIPYFPQRKFWLGKYLASYISFVFFKQWHLKKESGKRRKYTDNLVSTQYSYNSVSYIKFIVVFLPVKNTHLVSINFLNFGFSHFSWFLGESLQWRHVMSAIAGVFKYGDMWLWTWASFEWRCR